MSREGLDRLVRAQLADVDALVRGAGGKARVALPVHVQGRRRVEGKLLRALARAGVPDDGRLGEGENAASPKAVPPTPGPARYPDQRALVLALCRDAQPSRWQRAVCCHLGSTFNARAVWTLKQTGRRQPRKWSRHGLHPNPGCRF